MARAAWLLILVGCADPPSLVLATTTDGGTRQVETERAEVDQGFALIRILLAPIEIDAPMSELSVGVTATMPSMAHASPWADLDEDVPGTYEGPVELGMPGIWDLEGQVSDGELLEEFTLRISVR